MRKICQNLLLFKLFLVFFWSLLFSHSTHILFVFLTQEPRAKGKKTLKTSHSAGSRSTYCLSSTWRPRWMLSFKHQPWCFWYFDGRVCGNLGLFFHSDWNIRRPLYARNQGIISLYSLGLRPYAMFSIFQMSGYSNFLYICENLG